MNCIFLCRIWKIEDIQTVKTVPCSLFPVPCSLFPVPSPHRQIIQQALKSNSLSNRVLTFFGYS
ncbi:MAG: hypothetical protein ACK57T_22340 [Dolichospermum sp.]